ncbi:hypothetical protein CHUAL_003111 [Chamberlinius hualienensis]
MAEDESNGEPQKIDLVKLFRHSLEGWRYVLLPLDNLLLWRRVYDPAILIGFNSILFSLLWYYQPSVLSTFSVLGIICCLTDYFVPLITTNFFDQNKWSGKNEKHYEEVCYRLAVLWTNIQCFPALLNYLKETMPKMYFIVILSILTALAWVGNLMDNLLLTYLIINVLLLLPGLKYHGILNRYTKSTVDIIVKKLGKTIKTKKN